MADRLQFKEKLAGVLALAEDQNGKITVDEVEKYFEEDGLSQEQMNLVCDYLLSMKMAVIGYKQSGGTVKEAENEEQQPLSPDEQKYVEEYLRSLGDMNEETPEEVRMAYYLPKVAAKQHDKVLLVLLSDDLRLCQWEFFFQSVYHLNIALMMLPLVIVVAFIIIRILPQQNHSSGFVIPEETNCIIYPLLQVAEADDIAKIGRAHV